MQYCEFASNEVQKKGHFAILDKNSRFQTFWGNTKHLKLFESEKKDHIGPGTTELSYVVFGKFLTTFLAFLVEFL